MWVQLKTLKRVDERGVLKTYHPGDYVEVGKQTAMLWISQGEAIMPGQNYLKEFEILDGTGILIISDHNEEAQGALPERSALRGMEDLEVTIAPTRHLPFDKTIIWEPGCPLRTEMIPVGISLLDKWQIALPLWSYVELACHIGTEAERALTASIVHDLRVPLYQTGLIFVKRSGETKALMNEWAEECKRGPDPKLAFLRALYKRPLLVLALPASWHRIGE